MSLEAKSVAIGLILLSLLTSCAQKRINCSETEAYKRLWEETEKELFECVDKGDQAVY